MSLIGEPLAFEFFRQGLAASLLVGALCGMLGVYIVLRRMSYIGHGLSHSVFGGAVIGYVASLNFYLAAGVWGFLSALAINATARRRRIGADAAIGIVTTASFAIGVALISKTRSFTRNFEAALFGNILGVTPLDLLVVALVTLGVAGFILLFYKQLLFLTFDPEVAPIYGVRVGLVDSLFALAMAATIVASINVVGVTLIAATLVIPSTTARLVTDSFGRMIVISTLIGALAGGLGMYVSYWLDVSSGATIVLLEATLFVITLLVVSIAGRRPRWVEDSL
ncbi:MAG TPA: metal ABC transporter permease [Candidatus Limnocylindria bacterium]|nr:metal ABC transporter permease [Candidatus Limnocylindria bacterium]